MQRPGFNIACNGGSYARWGFCNNVPSQPCQVLESNDADAAIGIGLIGEGTPVEMGAGWTQHFASDSRNSMTFKSVWISVMTANGTTYYRIII